MTKNDLKIIFFGTPEFAVASLSKLIDGGYNIAAVVTMPDKQAGRGHHLIQSDVKKFAVEKGLPLLQPEKLKADSFISQLKSFNADLFIVIAFRMLPEIVWQMPRLGTFNLHASLLPKYRGAAPINWAIINGEKETGVTTFFLKHEIDTGDIIQQRKIAIEEQDNIGTVYDKLMWLGADMVIETVDSIIKGSFKTQPQSRICPDSPLVPAPKIFKETCLIDWGKPVNSVHNLVRGLSPYPAAWCHFEKEGKEYQIKIFQTHKTGTTVAQGTAAGSVKANNGKLLVACMDEWLEILELQLSGKKRMPANEFLRGFDINGIILNI